MTERLHDLLVREGEELDVPAPPAAAVLREGRRLRRRRGATLATALVAVVAVIAGGVFIGDRLNGPADGRGDDVAPAAAREGWAVAFGSTVWLGTGREVRVDGAVKSLYYTSAGVLARTGAESTTDAPDSRYALIADDGTVTGLDRDLRNRVPATDPTLPYLVYAEPTESARRWQVVLLDVRTGTVDRRIPVTGAFTWADWVAPPVALSGDHVYVGLDRATLVVDWRERTVTPSKVLGRAEAPDVAGGRVLQQMPSPVVRDIATGTVLRRFGNEIMTTFDVSPDGRYVIETSFGTCDVSSGCSMHEGMDLAVHDVDTGRRVDIADDERAQDVGWTSNGWLIVVQSDRIEVCDPDEGTCYPTQVEVGKGEIRVGGSTYEV